MKTLARNGWKDSLIYSLHRQLSFSLRISSVNVTKAPGNCGCGHIYWLLNKSLRKSSFFAVITAVYVHGCCLAALMLIIRNVRSNDKIQVELC